MKNSGKRHILLWRVRVEICCRNSKVDMKEIKMECVFQDQKKQQSVKKNRQLKSLFPAVKLRKVLFLSKPSGLCSNDSTDDLSAGEKEKGILTLKVAAYHYFSDCPPGK